MKLNEVIRDLREDAELKQREIAPLLGVSQQAYATYETGEYEPPISVLISIAEFHHVTVDYLLGLGEYRKCPEELDGKITKKITAGRLLAEIQKLDETEREEVVNYVQLLWIAHQVRKRQNRKNRNAQPD